MGHRQDSCLLLGDTFYSLCDSHPASTDQMNVTEWREKLEEEAPLLFFISARISNKDIHHNHSHPHFTSSRYEVVAVGLPVTGNHLKVQEQRKSCRSAKENSTRNSDRETWVWHSHQCWWPVVEARGDWSTLQPHIPSNNLHVPSIIRFWKPYGNSFWNMFEKKFADSPFAAIIVRTDDKSNQMVL